MRVEGFWLVRGPAWGRGRSCIGLHGFWLGKVCVGGSCIIGVDGF